MAQLDGLMKFYQESVEQADSDGYADKFKEGTEVFFQKIQQYAQEYNEEQKEVTKLSFTPMDVSYGDGYFIFGRGTNSVVHFHIKECPGWLFAIWWNKPESHTYKNEDGSTTEEMPSYIEGTFFTQYESNIDKFKPTRSEICYNFTLVPNWQEEKNTWGTAYEVWQSIKFIILEPNLAFCRDYCGWDYNVEFHTREEANEVKEKYEQWLVNKNNYELINDRMVMDFVTDKFLSQFKSYQIIDRGDGWSPRYDIYIPLEDNADQFQEPGTYRWFDMDNPADCALKKEYDAIIKQCEENASEYQFIWFSPIDEYLEVTPRDNLNKNQ